MGVEHSTQLSDRELALAVVEGRQEAFDALRERYYGSVLSFLTALVGDGAAAEAAEATFTAAREKLRTGQPDRFKSWLFAEAHRTGLALNERRTARPRFLGHPRRKGSRTAFGRQRTGGPDR